MPLFVPDKRGHDMANTLVSPRLTWRKPPWWWSYKRRLEYNKGQLRSWIRIKLGDVTSSAQAGSDQKRLIPLPPGMVLAAYEGDQACGRKARALSIYVRDLIEEMNAEIPGWRMYTDHNGFHSYTYTAIAVTPRSST